MASDPRHIAPLLERGLKSLSVGPAALAGVKAAIAAIRLGSLRWTASRRTAKELVAAYKAIFTGVL